MPGSVDECLTVLARRGREAKLVAGGTDLLPQMKNGVTRPACVIDISRLSELRTIALDGNGGLRLGAAVAARQIERDDRLRKAYPSLAESAALVGSIQVRNLATVGGNLCNAAPSADMAPPLVALDAEAVIAGPKGRRRSRRRARVDYARLRQRSTRSANAARSPRGISDGAMSSHAIARAARSSGLRLPR